MGSLDTTQVAGKHHPGLCMHAQSLSRVWLSDTLWTVALQAPLSMGFPRQDYLCGLPFPSPGDLPDPRIEPISSANPALQEGSLPQSHQGNTPRSLIIVSPIKRVSYKESWALKNWCSWTVLLEKTLESPLDCKEIQPVHPKGDQSWVFIGRMMLKLKLQYFGHLMRRTNSLEKTLILGKIEDKRWREQQRMEWHNWLNVHKCEQTRGDSEGQESLAHCSPSSNKILDMT